MINKTLTSVNTSAFIKIPIDGAEPGVYKVNVRDTNISGSIIQTHYIVVEGACAGDIPIKWLSKDGFYKFGTLSEYKAESQDSKAQLTIPTYFTSLLDTKSRNKVITKDLQRKWQLGKQNVPTDIFEYYLDLASSPKVYVDYTGLGGWIEAEINWNPSYRFKNKFHTIQLEMNLPESYIQRL